MSLTNKDVAKIAKLSRIAMGDDEVERYTGELNTIFQWIEQLSEVDTDGVEPMTGVGNQTLRLRADKVTQESIQDQVLSSATAAEFGCYKVPKMVE